jgi:predicted PurR-regulated permease PerM
VAEITQHSEDLDLDEEAQVEDLPERPDEDADETRFGELGRRFDRRSPFWIGLTGALGVGAAYLLADAVLSARGVLLLIFLALFIAVGLEPIVAVVYRHRVPRGLAVALVSLLVLGVILGFFALAIPPLVDQVTRLIDHAPNYLQALNDRSSFLGHFDRHYHLVSNLKKALTHVSLGSFTSGVIGAGKVVLGAVSSIVIVISLTIYFLADLPRVTRTIYRLVPASRRERAGLLIDEVFSRVGGYVLGNLLTSLIAGAGTFVWLWIFGIPYALLLSVFVALMDLIPIIGSTVAGVVVSLVALTVSPTDAVATAAFYTVYRQAEDYLITPRVMTRTVDVPPLVTVVAVLIGGALMGIIGALISIPVAAAIKLVLEEVSYPRLDRS